MKSTKRSLLLSVLSLMLCVSMLLGTTYAWFTDSVTSGMNRINAGNLDVEMYYKNPGNTEWANVATADSVDPKFFVDANGNDILWEPGVVAYANFKIANVGSLALKYNFKTIAKSFNTVNGKSLQDVIKFAVIENVQTAYATREAALAAAAGAEFAPMVDFGYAGNLMPNGEKFFTVVAYWEPNVLVDDDYNLKNGLTSSDDEPLYIDLEIQLVATQLMSEKDSFDETYDAGTPWLGAIDEVPAEEDGVIIIMTAEQLAGFAMSVNEGYDYKGKTIKLGKDIDLNNVAWTPINANNNLKPFTFDGNGKAIINLKVVGEKAVGLFAYATSCTIKNLTIDGANVSGINHVAAIAGNALCTKIEDCTVKNAVITTSVKNNDDGDKAGAVAGYLSAEPAASITGCTVENCTVTGYRDIGALVGMANGTSNVTGNTVTNCTVINDRTNNYKNYTTDTEFDVNEIVGEKHANATVENNSPTNVTILVMEEEGVITDPTDANTYYISNAAGLVNFAQKVNGGNTFANKTVKLAADVDLKGVAWTPLKRFEGTLDGQNHTIKNLKVEGYTGTYAGFISVVSGATIKNLNFANAEVYNDVSNEGGRGGIIVGWSYACQIDNCHVENAKISGLQKVGGILGCMSVEGSTSLNQITNCSVKNLTLSASDGDAIFQSGGLLGYIQLINANPNGVVIENNSVENITFNDDSPDYGNIGYYNGAFIGTIVNKQQVDGQKIVLNNNTVAGTNTEVFALYKYTSTYFGWAGNAEKYTSDPLAPIVIDGVIWTPAE
ncbi:MAG: SipW-dependent-type signal peptide-containing protein [Firmicutes bacterium]|nr:SipW-dependent-type signal peptide-containing protein [Candidatus Colimorpha enterica]